MDVLRRIRVPTTAWWIVGPILFVLLLGAVDPFRIRRRLDGMVEDQMLKHRPPAPVHSDLLQISMDDRAAEKLGITDRRHRLARALRQLPRLGAKTVLVDVLFLNEGSRNSFFQEESAYDGIPAEAADLANAERQSLLERYLEDRLLVVAFEEMPKVVIPFHHLSTVRRNSPAGSANNLTQMTDALVDDPGLTPDELAQRLALEHRMVHDLYEGAAERAADRIADAPDRATAVFRAHHCPVTERLRRVLDRRKVRRLVEQSASVEIPNGAKPARYDDHNLPPLQFARHATLGFADVEVDADGTLRRLPLLIRSGERAFVHEALAAVALHQETPIGSFALVDEGLQIESNNVAPIDARGQLLIDWPMNGQRSWHEVIPQISVADLLELARYDADLHYIAHNLRVNVAQLDEALQLGFDSYGWLTDIIEKYAAGQDAFAHKTEQWYDQTLIPQVLEHAKVQDLLKQAGETVSSSVEEQNPLVQLAFEIQAARRQLPQVRSERDRAVARLREVVEGKLCLVGDTTTGSTDLKLTPVGPQVPGVSVIASAVNTMLTGRYLRSQPAWFPYALTLLVGCLVSWAFVTSRAIVSMGAAFSAAVFLALGHTWVLRHTNILASPVLPIAGVVSCYFTLSTRRWWLAAKGRREIRRAFQHYLHPSVVDDLARNPDRLKLGGEEAELTILFSDIRSFSTISEQLSAGQLAELLNEYLSAMTEIVLAHGGTLDKYIGDAIMAFYGAPLANEHHAVDACRTALDMVRKLTELQADWRRRGFPEIDLGVGINTDRVAVGNFGSHQRFDYTVIGDGVNLASRLEGANKQYGTRVLISESTAQRLEDRIVAREVDVVRVKGKTEATRIFELLAEPPLPSGNLRAVSVFQEGLDAYRAARWRDAEACFRQVLATEPNDTVSRLYLERCEQHAREGTPADWDGVTVMAFK